MGAESKERPSAFKRSCRAAKKRVFCFCRKGKSVRVRRVDQSLIVCSQKKKQKKE